ncbi:MAG: O-antigen ligase family protein [candidate division WWE3 bacterium]|nr:O-antigen ligase family protein [candidate division WWE3 bacterium]
MMGLKSILGKVETACVALLFVVTPLIVTTFTYELFEFPKMIFVYFVGAALLASKLTQIIIDGRLPKINVDRKIVILFATFVIINAISVMFSPFKYTGLWGYYSRFSGGLISTFIYFGVFLVLLTWEKTKLLEVLKWLLMSSVLVAIYGIAQHFGLEKDRWVQDVTARVFSSFGQPNWLAAYNVLIIPVTFYFSLIMKSRRDKVIFSIILMLNFASLWFTFSMSGLVALVVSVIFIILLMNNKVRVTNWKLLTVQAACCLLIVVLQPGLAAGRISDTFKTIKSKVSVVTAAYAATTDLQVGDTGNIRLIVWQGVIKAALKDPKTFLIGNGPETVAYTLLPYRPLAMNQTSEWGLLYNKAHNYFLDLLLNTGIAGLLAYLCINIIAIITAIKTRNDTLKLAIGAALIGNLITNFFGWPVVMTSLIFALYLALLAKKDENII